MKKCDVLVVGGGISGASLGCMLAARTNLDVVVIEALDRLGGRARSIPFADGRIDYGLHSLLLGRRSSLFSLGKKITRGIAVKPVGASIFRHDRLERLIGPSPISILSSKGLGPISLLATMARAIGSGKRKDLYRISLDDFCRRFRATSETRDFLQCLSVGLVVNADYARVSAGEILAYLALSAKRVGLAGYPAGGWDSIWKRFEAILEGEKGRLRFREKLKEMHIEGNRVTDCLTDRETYRPACVVCAIPPRDILQQGLIPEGSLHDEEWKRIRACKMTYGLNVDLLIETDRPPSDMVFTLDPPTLAFAPTTASPGIVGKGRHLLTIYTPVGTDPKAASDSGVGADDLIELYGRIVPDLPDRVLSRKAAVLPTTGAEVTVDSNFLDRPRIKRSSPENLYFIGDWVRVPGVGGERAFASALACYGMLARDAGHAS